MKTTGRDLSHHLIGSSETNEKVKEQKACQDSRPPDKKKSNPGPPKYNLSYGIRNVTVRQALPYVTGELRTTHKRCNDVRGVLKTCI